MKIVKIEFNLLHEWLRDSWLNLPHQSFTESNSRRDFLFVCCVFLPPSLVGEVGERWRDKRVLKRLCRCYQWQKKMFIYYTNAHTDAAVSGCERMVLWGTYQHNNAAPAAPAAPPTEKSFYMRNISKAITGNRWKIILLLWCWVWWSCNGERYIKSLRVWRGTDWVVALASIYNSNKRALHYLYSTSFQMLILGRDNEDNISSSSQGMREGTISSYFVQCDTGHSCWMAV